MALFKFKKKNEEEKEMSFIVDDGQSVEEGLTKTFDVEGQSTDTIENTVEVTSEQPSLEDTQTDDLSELDDDDDYEYVTPQYGRKAFKLTLLCIVIGMVASFFYFKNSMEQQIMAVYQQQGYAITQIGATATAADIKEGKTAYVMGNLITGTYVELDTSLATATPADILQGFTAYVNGVKITGTIPTYSGTSMITPGTKDIKISKGTYLPDGIFVAGDGSLQGKNIKAGVKIFGITGTYK